MIKKSILFCGVGLFFLAVIVSIVLVSPSVSYDKESFFSNRNAFESIVLLCKSRFEEENANDLDVKIYAFGDDRCSLYCVNDRNSISLDDAMIGDFKTVKDVFILDHQHLDCLYVNKDYVSFTIESGRASFIYSFNDKKPNFINSPNDIIDHIYVKKITKNWYFTCNQD